ncbi:MAG: hypothetical protein O3A02_00340 [bacterium]|nr:hypothetical protein [bacterium]
METATPTLGAYVAGLKSPREAVRDRAAFLQRCAAKAAGPALAGLPLVGLGGSCGKPAFALPFPVTFDEARLDRLEAVAERFASFVEYGAYPHLKLLDGGQETAAIQDWTVGAFVFLRPGYERKEELLAAIADALR